MNLLTWPKALLYARKGRGYRFRQNSAGDGIDLFFDFPPGCLSALPCLPRRKFARLLDDEHRNRATLASCLPEGPGAFHRRRCHAAEDGNHFSVAIMQGGAGKARLNVCPGLEYR